MALSDLDISAAMRRLADDIFVVRNETATLDTDDIKAMVQDLDAYLDANAAAINTAIRVGVRSKATTPQKAFAMAYCCMKRAGVF